MRPEDSSSATGFGCDTCARQDVWDRQNAVINQALMAAPVLVGTVALARYRARKLLLYIPAVAALLTVWRRYVCARCRYYGTECSTLLGVMTAKMIPRDDMVPLDRNTMVADFAIMGAIMAMPLREVIRNPSLALAYLLSTVAGMGSILVNACGRCGNDFCPMKDLRRTLLKD
jgi:hypothetical protein